VHSSSVFSLAPGFRACTVSGIDVWVTVQTPQDSIVLTAGAFHQIINLTAVEGWSVNFMPECQIDTVASVREERQAGW